ncbi:MAG TPA: superoxide dismutase [Candidatus Limnocylindria bacterium]|nr:superoxide dismutase [Candidatus Limnocylindria bacterium]
MFTLPELKYNYAALEPYIDEATMKLHHDKHHQAYLDKLNAAIEGTEFAEWPIEKIVRNLEALPQDKRTVVRNNGGGHINHAMFWEIMAPQAGGTPKGVLAQKIDEAFGSFEQFQQKLEEAGIGQFGSGWAWLVLENGKLAVDKTPNQDNPLMNGKTPIMGVDVWEHAYYLKYQNRRPEYLKNWWHVVNWDEVGRRYEEAVKQGAIR